MKTNKHQFGNLERNPLKEKDFKIIVHYKGDTSEAGYDWWQSLEYTSRTVDGKKVDWKAENK